MLPPHSWNEVNDSQFNDCREIRQPILLAFGFPFDPLYKLVIKYKIRRNRMEALKYDDAEDIDP
jgi:hypothetical protein